MKQIFSESDLSKIEEIDLNQTNNQNPMEDDQEHEGNHSSSDQIQIDTKDIVSKS